MAMETKAITREQFHKSTAPIVGLQVAKPWLGYGNALFLELGALHFEALTRPKSLKRRKVRTKSLKGQAGVMIESEWCVERNGLFAFGIDCSDTQIRKGFKSIRRRRVQSVGVTSRGPELFLLLEGGYRIQSISTHRQPSWGLALGDPELFPRDPRWDAFDHSLWVTYDEEIGRLAKHMCYGPKPAVK